MFRKMRRELQSLSEALNEEILKTASSGILAVMGDEEYPYTVPLSYAYVDGKIYFHCALEGHKIDAVRKHEKVSFCVVEQDEVMPEELTTYFRSVVVFGKIRIIEERDEKRRALQHLGAKYSSDEEHIDREITMLFDKTCVLEINVEHMSGKESKALAAKRREGTL